MIALLIGLAQAGTAFLDQRFFCSFRNRTPCFLSIAAPLLLLAPVTAQERILFIGNSFTLASGDGRAEAIGGVPAIFDALARAGDHNDPDTVMRAVSGRDFEFHAGNKVTLEAISRNAWTHVVLQNFSTEPTHLANGSIENHRSFGTQLYDRIIANNSTTRVILYETFSRSAAHSLITGKTGVMSFENTGEFQGELRTHYQALAASLTRANPDNRPVLVAPVGSAWENAGGLLPEDAEGFVDLHSSDESHGNDNGYYLAAAVVYATVYGRSPEGLAESTQIQALNLNLTEDPEMLEQVASRTVGTSRFEAGRTILIDFGADEGTMAGRDDSASRWNDVTPRIGSSDDGELAGLRFMSGERSDVRLSMRRRFNGANQSGTTSSKVFPTDATRDSLFGNTERFGGIAGVFPSFVLAGLNPRMEYDLMFYASRGGVSDNRETDYTVAGMRDEVVALDPANNTDKYARLERCVPTPEGELSIAIAPGKANDNGNHFTYLGVLQITGGSSTSRIDFPPRIASTHVSDSLLTIEFSETIERAGAEALGNYTLIASGALVEIAAAPELQPDGRTVVAELSKHLIGPYTVSVANVADLAGNTIDAESRISGVAPDPFDRTFFFDFGGGTFSHKDAHGNVWNNVSNGVADSDHGELINIVDSTGARSGMGIVMIRRFNGVNMSGTKYHSTFPLEATRDSFYANTEMFSGRSNVFPSFKLTGLDPFVAYTFSMYASRLNAGDNRETGYTFTGVNSGFAALNVAENVSEIAKVEPMIPTAAGEIVIEINPTKNNNNRYHFTYLGAMRIDTGRRDGAIQFEITSVERTRDGFSLTWTSDPGVTYAIDVSQDLFEWDELVDSIGSHGNTTTFSDKPVGDVAFSHYRVRRN